MADNFNSNFDRNKAALDSIDMINKLVNLSSDNKGQLDPPNISEIINFNMKHLELEKNKGGFDEQKVTLITDAILVADNFIKNNPNNGGGNPSKNVVYFQDCLKNFIFGFDFSPQQPNLQKGQIVSISGAGYKGCGEVVSNPGGSIPIYTKPVVNKDYPDCQDCLNQQG